MHLIQTCGEFRSGGGGVSFVTEKIFLFRVRERDWGRRPYLIVAAEIGEAFREER